ncbi:3-deoxy-D-manno-octulosonic acid transferase [Sinomicrobium sp. FJxs]|uniref:3-deoxy-D-manno-octulosonic acid transferase n=2 Tax=Sinomicrobium weinanense TaxID=2842200 RepID=A0A926JN72_9FLAO|nr:glycosyltransferase N-terminal domain-containing protein [Sinomicrobium weinanense]MBC9794383.1 3-deoxy-D-manno-octulosonic acid transferase [Sinomicrobium weinanense]MBU3124290.1 3-deoxy-D-manno-octulosonic acid transferase [Sinomicrobium weinanense]
MLFIYNILVSLAGLLLKVIALFHKKTGLFVNGRKMVFTALKQQIAPGDRVIWFHTASLGEFEQGLPVIEKVKAGFPEHKILVTFFSPSGYEVKKNSKTADIITYLPLDTKSKVKKFLDIVQPELAVFVKYEFWPNYLHALKKRGINTILISAIFRKNQLFFKPYGGFMRRSLRTFTRFFVQDEQSKTLLNNAGIEQVTVSGDTRLDRVSEILLRDNSLDFMEAFRDNRPCFVAGSTWPEDEELLTHLINQNNTDTKFVLAPHHIKPSHNEELKRSIRKKVALYSEREGKNLSEYDVLIADTIGILTRIYSYADMAYVGGGMGSTGLHNILEPAVFGIPVIIGKHYSRFKEANELVALGGTLSVSGKEQLYDAFLKLTKNEPFRKETGQINAGYIKKNKGAVIQILEFIRTLL